MNTPTPAQALGEVIEAVWIADSPLACTVDSYDKACHAALTLIRNHGQHFAGLEKELASALACNRGLVRLNEATATRAEAAEARVREAEGLLRKWFMTTHGTLPPEVAAFLAAKVDV